ARRRPASLAAGPVCHDCDAGWQWRGQARPHARTRKDIIDSHSKFSIAWGLSRPQSFGRAWIQNDSGLSPRPAGHAVVGPIVFLAIDFDPLAKGYVANLSRPGGNVTGIFVRQLELAAKRVEIAREAFPRATVLGIAYDTISREQRDAAAEAA